MSHWTGATSNTALQEQDRQLSSLLETMKMIDRGTKQHHLLSGVEIASGISESAKRPAQVKAINFEIINESFPMSSRNLRTDTQVQNFEHGTTALYTSRSLFPSILSVAPPATEISSRAHMKSHMIFGSSFALSKSSQDNFTGTTSHVFPPGFDHGECRFDRGRIAAPSFILSRQEKVNHSRSVLASKKQYSSDTKVTVLEQERGDYHSYSEILVGNKNMDKYCSTSGKSVMPCFRKENDSSLLVNDPSTSNKQHSPACCEDQYQIMKNYPAISLFPSCSSLPKLTKLEMLHHGRCLHIKPSSAHNAKTTRICTSVEEVGGSPPRIYRTTHSLLNAKKSSDVNPCKENQIFRESRVLAQVTKKSSSELHSFDQLCGHGQQGVKLQLLGSSADGEGKGKVQDVNALEVVPKNESSAETDTMDVDNFKENHLSGVNSSPKDKDGLAGSYLPPYDDAVASGREVRRKRPVPELPDINIELPALPAAASSIDNAEPSASRTSKSLDMDHHLLLHAEQPSNAKSNNCQDGHLGPESSSRRNKRLKLGSSGSFSHGTKGLNLGEASHEKVTKFLSKIMKSETINSEPTSPKSCTGKELMVLNHGDSDKVDKGDGITLSHFWIQRWHRNKAATAQKKPEAVVGLEDSQKKQCPSIAAMALMGKAMNGFQRPCEFQNRGSFIVWNTKQY